MRCHCPWRGCVDARKPFVILAAVAPSCMTDIVGCKMFSGDDDAVETYL